MVSMRDPACNRDPASISTSYFDPGLYPGPGIYARPGFYPGFYDTLLLPI